MKAAVVKSPNNLQIEEVQEPIIGEYDAVCEILAASVCSGTDYHITHGDFYKKVDYPVILGHEAIGRVISCGQKVRNFQIGDIITRIINCLPENCGYNLMWGAFAERGIVKDWQAMRDDGFAKYLWFPYTINRVLPKSFDPIESTMIITWRETYSFLLRMKLNKNSLVLIIGSGANALAFAYHVRNLGFQSVIIGSLKRQQSFIKAGTKLFVSYLEKDLLKKIQESGCGQVDVIIDAVGKCETLNKLLALLKSRGKIGLYGLESFEEYSISVAKMQGDFCYYSGEYYDEGSAHDDIVNYIKKGKLNAWDFISRDHIYSLDKVNDAIEACHSRDVIKSIISFIH